MKPFENAIQYAQQHEVNWTRDPAAEPDRWGVHRDDPEPYNRLLGPVHARGGVSGVILQKGKEVARWGTPERADLTFSVAKTYLALLAGIAHRDGLLTDPHRTVASQLPGIGFDSEHNQSITWHHLLTQVSEWEGSCLGLPDTVDRYRHVAHDPKKVDGVKGSARPLQTPGTYWEYNDVRINRLSLSLLNLWKRPLPDVLTIDLRHGEREKQFRGAISRQLSSAMDQALRDGGQVILLLNLLIILFSSFVNLFFQSLTSSIIGTSVCNQCACSCFNHASYAHG